MAGPRRLGRRPAAEPPAATGRATIHDVAAAAGVSRQTVTRAMNDMPGISPDTRERVLRAARDLAYRPSRFGRGLVKGEHRTLGLVLDDLTNPYYPELASAVVGYAAKAGWNVLLADTVHADDPGVLVGTLAAQVDALVGYSLPEDDDERLAGLPVVRVDPLHPADGASVRLDYAPAMRQAVRRLVAARVRRPLLLDVADPGQPSGRIELAARLLGRARVRPTVVRTEATTLAAGAVMGELLDSGADLDAVLAFNDSVALGALSACLRRGVAVPDRVRVVGVDGLSLGLVVTPQLTTLAVDLTEVARHAVELALGMHGGLLPRTGREVQRTVRHRLLVRESA